MRFSSLVRSAFVLALAVANTLCAAVPNELDQLLPDPNETPGWSRAEPPRLFVGEDLFELIDGGAELFHEYGFARACSARYEGESAAGLQIEIYEMRSAAAAFGVFSMMQSPRGAAAAIGDAARLFPDYLLFWKGRYYVSVTITGAPTVTRAVLTAIARQIAARIGETGAEPELLTALPGEQLQDRKYFRGAIALSNLHVFGGGDLFDFREGVCGFYPGLRLFILRYDSADDAARHLVSARERLAQERSYREVTVTADGFACEDAEGNRIEAQGEADRIVVRIGARGPGGL